MCVLPTISFNSYGCNTHVIKRINLHTQMLLVWHSSFFSYTSILAILPYCTQIGQNSMGVLVNLGTIGLKLIKNSYFTLLHTDWPNSIGTLVNLCTRGLTGIEIQKLAIFHRSWYTIDEFQNPFKDKELQEIPANPLQ